MILSENRFPLFGIMRVLFPAADELQHDFTAVGLAPVLHQIDALPGAERELGAGDRHMQRTRR